MWAVVVLYVTAWGPVTELGKLAETDDFSSCVYLSNLATQANTPMDSKQEYLIFCKRIEE